MLIEHMRQNPDANIILVGHLHNAFTHWRWVKCADPGNFKARMRKQGGAMSSSFVEFWANYSEVAGMDGADVMMARIVLEPTGKWGLTHR
jgi:hypothetical protein